MSNETAGFLPEIVLTLLGSIAVAVGGYLIVRVMTRTLHSVINGFLATQKLRHNPLLVQFGVYAIQGILLLMVALAVLSTLGINTNSLVAVFATAGIAITLALQDVLKNFASGVLIVAFQPFEKGDAIEVGTVKGNVEDVQLFTTIINTPDNMRVIVPNAKINNDVIINKSANDRRRVDLLFRISYDTDIRLVKAIIEPILRQDQHVLADPVPEITVNELAPSSINLNVRLWVKSDDYGTAKSNLIEKIKVAFDEHGITIPYPQQSVYLRSDDALSSGKTGDS